MKLLDAMHRQATGRRRMDEFVPFTVEYFQNNRPSVSAVTEEHVLRVTFERTFWANKSALMDAMKTAERALLYDVYGDALDGMRGLRLAIYEGDRHKALVLCDRVERLMRYGEDEA